MDLLINLFWLLIGAVVVVVVVRYVLDRVSALRNWLRKHRAKIIVGSIAVVGAGTVLLVVRAGWFAASLPGAVPAAAELEATVASQWSAASTGTRISSGIALTTAAARGEADGATWQTWTTIPGANQAVQMQPSAPYQFTLALTPGEVRLAGAQRTIASAAAQQTVRDTLLTQQRVTLQAVLLADPERLALQAGESAVKPLVIDVPRLLGDRQTRQIPTTSVDALLERAFGSVSYGVEAGTKQGWVQASVLLMANNRGLDQIVTTHCIGECSGEPPEGRVSGSPRLLALMQKADSADISLFLTDLKQDAVHGVLVTREPVNGQTLWTWNTSYPSATAFANELETAFKNTYKALDSRKWLLDRGDSLSRLVFGGTPAGLEAKQVFNELARQSSQWRLGDGQGPKSLFFHFDFLGKEGLPMALPVGLMTITDAGGNRDFAGHYFQIEQPMLKQPSYGAPSQCAANWQVLMPETDNDQDPLYLARKAMAVLDTSWPSAERFTQYDSIDKFKQWVTHGKTQEPTIVTTLSHHFENKLYFVEGDEEIPSSDVLRTFGPSSIAILDGCGTGKPGAMDFVARFNSNGIHSAIVSAYDVNPAVAGMYLACLRQQVARGTRTIAAAHFYAVNDCEWPDGKAPPISADPNPPTLTSATYSANALKYVLLGNAATTVCQ